jgi:hypothetical protein
MRKIVFALCLALAGVAGVAEAKPRQADKSADFARRVLDAHNGERARLHLPLLAWSPILAAHAKAWAQEMARTGQFVHSSNESRPGEGESMFRHNAGAFGPEQMVGTFLAERPNFKAGKFPDIARDGNWMHAGHYSQLIWPTTIELGCGLVVAQGMDWFVCRYSPPGNMRGQRVGYAN